MPALETRSEAPHRPIQRGELAERIALGASRGIGRAIAERLAREDASGGR
jgi:hypothetical protein